jgi:GAG-pre-integrase domain
MARSWIALRLRYRFVIIHSKLKCQGLVRAGVRYMWIDPIYKDNMLVASTIRDGKLFCLKIVQEVHTRAAVTAESAEAWHRRLAHLGEENIKKLEGMATGIKVDPNSTVGTCSSCLKAISIVIHPRKQAIELQIFLDESTVMCLVQSPQSQQGEQIMESCSMITSLDIPGSMA